MSFNPAINTQMVADHYSALAREDLTNNQTHINKVAESFGYTPEDLAGIPEGANLGVSCGNPLAIASLKAGETVLDLGCGAGFDVFQAARKIGPTGLSIGVDISQDMLDRATRNASTSHITNVKFVLAPITSIPLPSSSTDCIISNCVINLLTNSEKPICLAEVYRLLKPGGRLAVSDILAKKEFPEALQKDLGLYVGCISGASLVGEYEGWLRDAGFQDIMIVDKHMDLNIYKERIYDVRNDSIGIEEACCDQNEVKASSACCALKEEEKKENSCCGAGDEKERDAARHRVTKEVESIDFNEWVSSYSIYAVKPQRE